MYFEANSNYCRQFGFHFVHCICKHFALKATGAFLNFCFKRYFRTFICRIRKRNGHLQLFKCFCKGSFLWVDSEQDHWFKSCKITGSWCFKGTIKSLPSVDSSVPLMHNDLGSLILIKKNSRLYLSTVRLKL